MISLDFHNLRINSFAGSLEVIFSYAGQWYKLDWDCAPERLKQLYSVYLRLQGLQDEVTGYDKSEICVGSTTVEIDLSKCTPISHEYPVS